MRHLAGLLVLILAGCSTPKVEIATPWGTYSSSKDVGLILEIEIDPETQQPSKVYVEATGLASPVTRAQAEAWTALARFVEVIPRAPGM